MLGSVNREAQRIERIDDLHLDRPDLVGISAVERRTARGVDVDLLSVDCSTIEYDAEVSVSDMAVWIQAHREGKEQTSVFCVAVEEVAVVVIEVGPGSLSHRM